MIYSSLAILAVATTAAVPSLTNLVHLHPHAKTDDRVSVLFLNRAHHFQDLSVDGHIYTISADSNIRIKAPAGTLVLRATPSPYHAKGEVLVAMTPALNDQTIELK